MKKKYLGLIIFLFFLLVIGTGESAWLNSSCSNYKNITITNNYDYELVDFPITDITFNTSGVEVTGKDIWVYNSTGSVINYSLVQLASDSYNMSFKVNIDGFGGTTNTNTSVYYGCGENSFNNDTFEHAFYNIYDDFLGTSLSSKWTVDPKFTGYAVSGSYLTITTMDSSSSWNENYAIYQNFVIEPHIGFFYRARDFGFDSDDPEVDRMGIGVSNGSEWYGYWTSDRYPVCAVMFEDGTPASKGARQTNVNDTSGTIEGAGTQPEIGGGNLTIFRWANRTACSYWNTSDATGQQRCHALGQQIVNVSIVGTRNDNNQNIGDFKYHEIMLYKRLNTTWEPTAFLEDAQSPPAVPPTNITLLFNSTEGNYTMGYGSIINITADINTSGMVGMVLYKDSVLVNTESAGSGNLTNITSTGWFANATYNITAHFPGNASYGESNRTAFVRVNKAGTIIDMWLNGTKNGDKTLTYPSDANATCKINTTLTYNLVRNGTAKGSQTVQTFTYNDDLGASVYNITCYYDTSANYTNSTQMNFLTMNKNTTTINLVINGSASNSTVTFGNVSNITAWDYNNNSVIDLFRNDSTMSNPYIVLLGGGHYFFKANITTNPNYTGTANTSALIVTPISSAIELYLNGTNGNKTYDADEVMNITLYLPTPTGQTVSIFRDDALYNSSASPIFNTTTGWTAGEYKITGNWTGNANYTTSTKTHYAIIITYRDTCNATNIGAKTCGGYNFKYILTCSNNSGIYEWNNTDRDFCKWGCWRGKCLNFTTPAPNKCSINQTMCGGLNDKYVIPCRNTSGVLQWSNNVSLWTFCNFTCNNGQCYDFPVGSEAGTCNVGTAICRDKHVINCRDTNLDGVYTWDIDNRTNCEFGCSETTNSYGINATCLDQPGSIVGIDAYKFGEWVGVIGLGFDMAFPSLTDKFFMFLVLTVGVSTFLTYKFKWQFGLISALAILLMGTFVAWVPYYITIITLVIGGILWYSKREESGSEF